MVNMKKEGKAVSIPVFTVYQINSGSLAEAILQDTSVDMVQVGRDSLVNYAWADNVKNGIDSGRCLNCPACLWMAEPDECPGKRVWERRRQQKLQASDNHG